jgi:hypothetical protein
VIAAVTAQAAATNRHPQTPHRSAGEDHSPLTSHATKPTGTRPGCSPNNRSKDLSNTTPGYRTGPASIGHLAVAEIRSPSPF